MPGSRIPGSNRVAGNFLNCLKVIERMPRPPLSRLTGRAHYLFAKHRAAF
jgi:hypothetical protein